MIDKETAERFEAKLDRVLDALPVIEALGRILIRRRTAMERTGIAGSTLDRSKKVKKYEEIGHKRVFVEVGEVGAIQRRKPKRK